ncbi:cupin-like domain-containing protein [Aliiglaciecola sp. M165]|uniref:cupin-like domain-containing protein n=1 Tax=Aliiglaciecola sp. M165 TaxID=2593649 RepID=UPI00117FE17C|nr:cupin-like domain-containing protein [Aliiglaciecola sp. M165]TRY31734.1 cupin-like domain-containing protein [Aliiglaciecola sp. M165]
MLSFSSKNTIKEIHSASESDLTSELLCCNEPAVLRGLIKSWPLVQAAEKSAQHAADYLTSSANDRPVQAFVAGAAEQGRFFYNETMDGFNFSPKTTNFKNVIDDIFAHANNPALDSTYLGSTSINHILPEFRLHNEVDLLKDSPLVSIWVGTPSRIAAHYDIPDNLACVATGKRRFTLFPPDQIDNLYVGPLDFTPAGQSASMVDFHNVDYRQFPKFKEAIEQSIIIELAPGDALFIPSMWWHHVEGLEDFNVLVNYWWRQVPNFMGTPLDALNHGILSIRDLPKAQRDIWRNMFEHYVFSAREPTHIPPERRGSLNPLDETLARQIRAALINKLNR